MTTEQVKVFLEQANIKGEVVVTKEEYEYYDEEEDGKWL